MSENEIRALHDIVYFSDEPLPIIMELVAEGNEVPYTVTDTFSVSLDFKSAEDTEINCIVEALPDPSEQGVRLTALVPISVTSTWPVDRFSGFVRLRLGTGSAAQTLAAGALKPSKFGTKH